MTRQIGGTSMDLDGDLEKLRFMKGMLVDVGGVTVERTTHD